MYVHKKGVTLHLKLTVTNYRHTCRMSYIHESSCDGSSFALFFSFFLLLLPENMVFGEY